MAARLKPCPTQNRFLKHALTVRRRDKPRLYGELPKWAAFAGKFFCRAGIYIYIYIVVRAARHESHASDRTLQIAHKEKKQCEGCGLLSCY